MEQALDLNLDDARQMAAVGKALSSEVRIRMLRLLCRGPGNVNELAEQLELPQSSAAMHVKVLEEAGLIRTELLPGTRGSMKLCTLSAGSLQMKMETRETGPCRQEEISMPVGHFVDYSVEPTCGLVGVRGPIGEEDEPRCFFEPERVDAQLIWLGGGYLEYRFPNRRLEDAQVKALEISAEVCSEDHEYNLDWPSDITMWVNGLEVGTWTCPSDYGGRRGRLNPDWWPDKNTQYGKLKTWRITEKGCYVDGRKTTSRGISQFQLENAPYITVRLGIREDAKHQGGLNLFGESFGDHRQNIVMKIIYE